MVTIINKPNDPNAAASQEVRQQGVQNRGTNFQALMQSLRTEPTKTDSTLKSGENPPPSADSPQYSSTSPGSTEEQIKSAVNNLQTAAHAMAQQYAGGASRGGPPPSGGGSSGGDDVIDAEYEVKK